MPRSPLLDGLVRLRAATTVGLLARAYARLLGAHHDRHRVGSAELHVCWGLPRRAYPRGGVTWGDTYLTGASPATRTAARLRHEAAHAAQWRRYGYLFALLYLRAGRDPRANRFEVEAGLDDGGYGPGDRGAGSGHPVRASKDLRTP